MKAGFEGIIGLVIQKEGVNLLPYEDTFLQKTLENRMHVLDITSVDNYCQHLKQSIDEIKLLTAALQNNYTEFFRHSLTYAVMEHIVLQELIQRKKLSKSKTIRVWSAACAGGQEAYSIAMLLQESLKYDTVNMPFHIFATDISQRQIDIATAGKYIQSAVNNLSFKWLNKYFNKNGNTYTVVPALQKHIDFSVFDLLSETHSSPPASIYGGFDIVFCANVLYYYKEKYRNDIINKISNAMDKGAYFVCSEAERSFLKSHNFKEVYELSCVFKKIK